jgi:hypothetical protein
MKLSERGKCLNGVMPVKFVMDYLSFWLSSYDSEVRKSIGRMLKAVKSSFDSSA